MTNELSHPSLWVLPLLANLFSSLPPFFLHMFQPGKHPYFLCKQPINIFYYPLWTETHDPSFTFFTSGRMGRWLTSQGCRTGPCRDNSRPLESQGDSNTHVLSLHMLLKSANRVRPATMGRWNSADKSVCPRHTSSRRPQSKSQHMLLKDCMCIKGDDAHGDTQAAAKLTDPGLVRSV